MSQYDRAIQRRAVERCSKHDMIVGRKRVQPEGATVVFDIISFLFLPV